jgi:SP family sugar:H+ symporter-like MFS transporter
VALDVHGRGAPLDRLRRRGARGPRSPRFLVASGRDAEAQRVLDRVDPGLPASEIDTIRRTVRTERAPRLADLRREGGRGILPVVWIGAGLSVLQQAAGINSTFYYGAILWGSVGFTSRDSLGINVFTGVVNIVSTLIAMSLIDRVGRRPSSRSGSPTGS